MKMWQTLTQGMLSWTHFPRWTGHQIGSQRQLRELWIIIKPKDGWGSDKPSPIESIVARESQEATFITADWSREFMRVSIHWAVNCAMILNNEGYWIGKNYLCAHTSKYWDKCFGFRHLRYVGYHSVKFARDLTSKTGKHDLPLALVNIS